MTDAVIVGDRLGHLELARPGELATDQLAAQLVRSGVESPRESLLRLALVLAGLPEPECNAWVVDGGRRLARVDLYYPHHRVSLDYEGDHHRTDRRQWNRDIERYADLAAAGVEAIRVTALGLQRANNVVLRTYRALQDRGYAGPPPHFGPLWMPSFSRPRGVAWNQVPITAL